MNTNQTQPRLISRRAIAVSMAGLALAGTIGVTMAQNGTAAPTSVVTVSQATEDAALLAFNREEERMARDLYQALAEHYAGAAPFAMITRSEQMHWNAVGSLLTRHGITDPSAGLAPGTYADPAIQRLYDGWLKRGLTSLDTAYQVGIELEKRDIADLTSAISATSLTDARQVLTHLRTASERHLSAFQAAASGKTTGLGTGQGMGQGGGPSGLGAMHQGRTQSPGGPSPLRGTGRMSVADGSGCPNT